MFYDSIMAIFNSIDIWLVTTPIGISLIFYGIKIWNMAKETLNWPMVSGKVVQSYYTNFWGRIVSRKEKGLFSKKRQDDRHHLQYVYEVGGITYYSEKRIFGPTFLGANTLVKDYPVGLDVNVYYNPIDHSKAVLKPGINLVHYYILVSGPLLIFVGFVPIWAPFLLSIIF
jgi:hypothetical protein